MRVNKALPSRWANDVTRPGGPSLEALTKVLEARCEGFNQLSWDLPFDQFRALFPSVGPGPAPYGKTSPSLINTAVTVSPAEVARFAGIYAGAYACFHTFSVPPGELVAALVLIWREGDQLFARLQYPGIEFSGEIFVDRNHLFAALQLTKSEPAASFVYINPIFGPKAMMIDSLVMTLAWDGAATPSAGRMIGVRIADAPQTGTLSRSWQSAVAKRMSKINFSREVDGLAGPRLAGALKNHEPGVGLRDMALLRVPASDEFSVSSLYVQPEVAADIQHIQAVLVPEEGV